MSDDFVRDLEQELVAAARYRAAHGPRRRLPRVPVARPAAVLAALALALVAVLALARGGDERPAEPPPPGATFALPAMQPLVACNEPAAEQGPAPVRGLRLLERPQRADDRLGIPAARLPIGTFDARAVRRVPAGLEQDVRVVPSQHVSRAGRCGVDDGPGLCLVLAERRFRCFTAADVAAGRAVALTPEGAAVGLVPDGVTEVMLYGGGRQDTEAPEENAYATGALDVAPGTQFEVTLEAEQSCGGVDPELRARYAVLAGPARGVLPRPALAVLNHWGAQIDTIVEDGARRAARDGVVDGDAVVDFWAVPVVPEGAGHCAPASDLCIVAIPDRAEADAACLLADRAAGEAWRLGPLLPDNAVIYGVAPGDVDRVLVTIGTESAAVDVHDDVVAGVLPFPYRDGARVDVEHLPRPTVAVVDATSGDRPTAEAVLDQVRDSGYGYLDAIAPGVTPQPSSELYWHPDRASRYEAQLLAERLDVDDVTRIGDPARTPRPVQQLDADLVVVVGAP